MSIIKKIVNRLNPNAHDDPAEQVYVAAFGKHPGWNDHIDDIGLNTDTLVAAKRILYIQGIGENIDSGSWDKLQPDQQFGPFKHVFVWHKNKSIIVGRLWSSEDGKGRKNYPMIVCAQCNKLPLDWIYRNILPRLEDIEKTCTGTNSAADVQACVANAQEEFRRLVQQDHVPQKPPMTNEDVIARIAASPELGPEHEGLVRILYHIDREVKGYCPEGRKTDNILNPTLVRCPVSLDTQSEDMLLWFRFLRAKFKSNIDVLMFLPQDDPWVDMVIGEPTSTQLYCLRALLGAVPLTSSVPYNMDPEFIKQIDQLIRNSLSQNVNGGAKLSHLAGG